MLLVAPFVASPVRDAVATHQPANKMAVSGSALAEMTVPVVEGSTSKTVTLLKGTLKTSNLTDLVISATAECALWTDVQTVGDGDSQAVATVKVWVEIDGVVVPVSADDKTEPGKVVFCDRAVRLVTVNLDDDDTIKLFQRTRSANAFNWIRLNLGSAPSPHVVELKALLEAQVTGVGMAKAEVGKRTLVVQPEKLAGDASI